MRELGYGRAYRYAHDEPEGYAAGEDYFPEGLRRRRYYKPVPRGLELKIRDKLEHLAALDYLRQGIHLRGYAQKNPKQEYKREAFQLFAQLLDAVKLEVTRILMNVRIQSQDEAQRAAEAAALQAEQIVDMQSVEVGESETISVNIEHLQEEEIGIIERRAVDEIQR